jgi:RimJ/RimL family protein N-acetyltransferase
MNADPRVMEFFGGAAFFGGERRDDRRNQRTTAQHGFGFFAVELRDTESDRARRALAGSV